ncbi:unnamed protein product [marine sediment metagenome]|uniref:Uncharacterized protein n=1 Tax=marine sediment metagenome TaxID=412755 RepID=X0V8H6_9ZZZZ
MSDMKGIIGLEGTLVTIRKKTKGAIGAYGDPVVTWTSESEKERVWIQAATTVRSPETSRTIAGNLDTSTYLGLLIPDTNIETGNILVEENGTRYKVGRILPITMVGEVSHNETLLSLMPSLIKTHVKTFTADAVLVVPIKTFTADAVLVVP